MKFIIYTSHSSISLCRLGIINEKVQIYQKCHEFISEEFHRQALKRWEELKAIRAITIQPMKRVHVHLKYNYHSNGSH